MSIIRIENKSCDQLLRELPDESVDMVFADPPFNIGINYDSYTDKRSDYKEWCACWIAQCYRILKPTGSFYLMTIDCHLEWKMPLMAKHGHFINLIKWKNVSAKHDKRCFWNAVQPIMLYGKTENYKFNTYAQTRTAKEMVMSWNKKRAANAKYQLLDYWDDIPLVYAGSIKHKEAILKPGTKKKAHPCQMPEMLAGRAILFSTDEGDTVVDPFTGSGTTAAASEKLNRHFIGCEESSFSHGVAINRLNNQTFNLFKSI